MKNKVCRCVLTFSMFVSLLLGTENTFVAVAKENDIPTYSLYEEIMNEYYSARIEILQSDNAVISLYNSELDILKNERNQALLDAGYTIYEVNNNNIDFIEAELETDLGEIGLDDGGEYLIVLGKDMQEGVNGDASSSFTYTYNGKTYTMRTLTVTANSDEASPLYVQASDVDLLSSSAQTVITNALNTVIYACVSAASTPLGTIASICGFDISRFYPNSQVTMRLNAASNWTREYTQVYDDYYKTWTYGSYVENVYCLTYISGSYYKASDNLMDTFPEDKSGERIYSAQYYNSTWRRQQAAIAFSSGSVCIADRTGAVQYKYDDKVKITHPENF